MGVVLTGVKQVFGQLGQIQNAAQNVADSMEAMGYAGAALLAGAGALAIGSVNAFESFERVRRTMSNMLGEKIGTKLAYDIQKFTIEANASTEALQNVANVWTGMTADAKGLLPILKALEKNSSSMTDLQLTNAGYVLSQIKAGGKVMGNDILQLVNSGLPLNKIAEELGVKSIRETTQMNGDKFIAGFLRAMDKLPDRTPLLTRMLNNIMDAFKSSIVPTGQLVTAALMPLVMVANTLVTAFNKFNLATGGALGFVLIIAAFRAGLVMLIPIMQMLAAQAVVWLHNNQAVMASAGKTFNGGGMMKAMALMMAFHALQPEIEALIEAFKPFITMIVDALKPAITWVVSQFQAINSILGGWPSKILAAVILLAQIKNLGLAQMTMTMAKATWDYVKGIRVAAIWNAIVAGWEIIKAQAGAAWAFATGNWAGAAIAVAILAGLGVGIAAMVGGGRRSGESSSNGANRPQRRSSWENIWHRRYAHERGV